MYIRAHVCVCVCYWHCSGVWGSAQGYQVMRGGHQHRWDFHYHSWNQVCRRLGEGTEAGLSPVAAVFIWCCHAYVGSPFLFRSRRGCTMRLQGSPRSVWAGPPRHQPIREPVGLEELSLVTATGDKAFACGLPRRFSLFVSLFYLVVFSSLSTFSLVMSRSLFSVPSSASDCFHRPYSIMSSVNFLNRRSASGLLRTWYCRWSHWTLIRWSTSLSQLHPVQRPLR